MVIDRKINCKSHQDFADYLSIRLATELPMMPKYNGTDIYLHNIKLSIRIHEPFFFMVLTDVDGTELIMDKNLYKSEHRRIDSYIAEYQNPQFVIDINPGLIKKDSTQEFSTRISSDWDELIDHISDSLRIAESRPERVWDYNKNDVKISIRMYNHHENRYFITFIKKADSNYTDINVLGTYYSSYHERRWSLFGITEKLDTTKTMLKILNKY